MATSTILINLYDGSRQRVPPGTDLLVTVRDGNQQNHVSQFFHASEINVRVPFHENFSDDYTVLASAKQHEDAGLFPVKVQKDQTHRVHLMLIDRQAGFRFARARWQDLEAARPNLFAFLNSDPEAPQKYPELMEQQAACLACLLNITAAIELLPFDPNLLTYFRSLDLRRLGDERFPEGVKPDRFFAWADPALKNVVAASRMFENAPADLHPGATSSFKEIRFNEANLQFTFHENDVRRIGNTDCVRVEMDIDYYKDKGAHFLLEVVPNAAARALHLGPGLTDPRTVYALRWMAGKVAAPPDEFDPLYTIEAG